MDFSRQINDVAQNKRRHIRLDFHCPALIGGLKGVKKVTDISIGGFFVELPDNSVIKKGMLLDVLLKIPTLDEYIKTKSKAVFVSERGLGCQFVKLLPKYERAIKECIDMFEDTLPIA